MNQAQTLHSNATGPIYQRQEDIVSIYTIPIIGSIIYRIWRIYSRHNSLFLAHDPGISSKNHSWLARTEHWFQGNERALGQATFLPTCSVLSEVQYFHSAHESLRRTSPARSPLPPTKVDLIDDNIDIVSTSAPVERENG